MRLHPLTSPALPFRARLTSRGRETAQPLLRQAVTSRGRETAKPKRNGFTLLEVILAVSLSVVLLAALYLALSMNYYHTRAGRELMDETILIRSVVNRISQDVGCQLPPFDQRLVPTNSSSSGGSGGSGGSGSSGGAASTSSGGASSGSSGSSSAPGAGSSSNPNAGGSSGSTPTPVSNFQIYGNESGLVLSGRWAPRDLTLPPQSDPTMTADLRTITYWISPDQGLMRQESMQVTGTAAFTYPPTLPPQDGQGDVIAPEVKSWKIEYYDGNTWQTTWDGSIVDPSGNTPQSIGPPAAIAFNLVFTLPTHGVKKTRDVNYRHVVVIRAANNFLATQPETSTSSTGTTPSGASSAPNNP